MASPAGLEVVSDDLQAFYTRVAEDSDESESRRKAARLFVLAERRLTEEDHTQALRLAEEALGIFQELVDSRATLDCLRLVIHAHQLRADEARAAGDNSGARDALKLAEGILQEALEAFRAAQSCRGQAAMLLSLAELNCNHRGSKKRDESLNAADEARLLFKECEDPRMEARAYLVASKALYKKHRVSDAKRAGEEAIRLFQAANDGLGEARSWLALAAADALDGRHDDALRSLRKARKLAQACGHQELQGKLLHSAASWLLEKGDSKAALAAARESVAAFKEFGKARCWEVSALCLVAQALCLEGEAEPALALLGQEIEAAQRSTASSGSAKVAAQAARDEVTLLLQLVNVHMSMGNFEVALETAQESLLRCREVGNAWCEAAVMESIAKIYKSMRRSGEAKSAALQSLECLKGLRARKDENEAQIHMLVPMLAQADDAAGAVKVAAQARALAQEREDRNMEAWSLLTACVTHGLSQDFSSAVKAGELASEVFRDEGNRRGEAKSLRALAEIFLRVGNYSSASRSARQAEALLEGFGDERLLASVKQSLARILMEDGDSRAASQVALEAVKICRASEDMEETAKMIFVAIEVNLACLSREREGPKELREFRELCDRSWRLAQEAAGISIRLNKKPLEAEAQHWRGSVLLVMGRTQDSELSANAALTLWRELEDRDGEVSGLVLLAQVKLSLKDNAAASTALREALALADGQHRTGVIRKLLEEVSTMSQAMAQEASRPNEEREAESPESSPSPSGVSTAESSFKAPNRELVQGYIVGLVKQISSNDDEEFELDTPLLDTGIDSLSSIQLRAQLSSEFRVNLPSTVVFSYPTVGALADLLVEECTTKQIAWG
ncbi:unnamed protein product [Polarella glacialis]|uniref:Carrier domain-containing protein n=1 Tax=Polarella glacialis TaxID=89957 RepID=A0A813G0A0_POLGL|nr:unnamed protein product [Polarella glacialis]